MNVLVVSYVPGSDLLVSLAVDRPPRPGDVLHVDDRSVRVLRAIPLVAVHDHAYSVVVAELPASASEALPREGESRVATEGHTSLGSAGGSALPLA
ncbi:hypothetical protein [Halomonas sp. M4R1S46]|uniref:hypothetical protein n=1 Tax=Halomonas sp. M4R1S46 TaxID=2982692 RepID=UPI0021E38A8A|nr:hypothetical protein [Halomonas sp. M4R1S46]UYG09595.1 hypothetical protein OCT48_09760 [Halomonas sp. M4R1S46]